MGGRGSGRKLDTAKRERAATLREQGKTLAQIAEALGVTRSRAHQLLRDRPRGSNRRLYCPGCGRDFGLTGVPGDEGLCLECLRRPGLHSVGDRIRAHRLAAGLSPAALARLAGVRTVTGREAERDEHRPTPHTLRRLAGALGVKAGELDPLRGAGA
jgi:transcriptional regulator with XRE-family HTH domain